MTGGYLVLDIETIPDRDVHTPPEPAPGSERAFPPLYACKPIVLGVLWLDDAFALRRIGTIGEGKDEAGMLADFSDFMTTRKPDLVTWNGRGFDLPVLALRAMRHGLSFPWYYRAPDVRYRYSEKGHLDLCDLLSDHGAARSTSLSGAARLIGLPGKEGVDGSQVEGLHNAGQLEALRRYCLSDVIQTSFLFLRSRLLIGHWDRAQYHDIANKLFVALLADGRFDKLLGAVDRDRLLLPGAAVAHDAEATSNTDSALAESPAPVEDAEDGADAEARSERASPST